MKLKYKPTIGDKYGQWTVISDKIKRNSPNRNTYWQVVCECGKTGWRFASALVNSKTQSCKSCARSFTTEDAFMKSYLNRVEKRAKVKNIKYDLTESFLTTLIKFQDYKCALSGLPITLRGKWRGTINQTASLDRINSDEGYIETNVQWLHKDVNMMKLTHDQDYFLELCRAIIK